MIQYECPKCHGALESPTSLAGQIDVCPRCQHNNTVPRTTSIPWLTISIYIGGSALILAVIIGVVMWTHMDNPRKPNGLARWSDLSRKDTDEEPKGRTVRTREPNRSPAPTPRPKRPAAKTTAAKWTNDWSIFVKELSAAATKDNYFVGNVNSAFSGKRVQWTGKVTEIEQPEKAGDSGCIRLAMKSERLVMKSGSPVLDSLILAPEAGEWKSWQEVSVGTVVEFSTVLDEGSLAPACVLVKMDGMGSNAGKVIAWINTKGGICRGVLRK